jgi:hypothetical protein
LGFHISLENSLADIMCCYRTKMETYTRFDPLMRHTCTLLPCKRKLAEENMKVYARCNFISARIHTCIRLCNILHMGLWLFEEINETIYYYEFSDYEINEN